MVCGEALYLTRRIQGSILQAVRKVQNHLGIFLIAMTLHSVPTAAQSPKDAQISSPAPLPNSARPSRRSAWNSSARTPAPPRTDAQTDFLELAANGAPRSGISGKKVTPRKLVLPPPATSTVTLISGEPGSTALQVAHDLSVVLNSERLRVLTLLGAGGEQNITDVLRTKGVDMGIIATPDLRQAERTEANKRVVYITKLFNAELHVLARRDIVHVTDLDGETVNLGEVGSSSQTASREVLKHLGIRFKEANMDQKEALDRMRAGGSIAATFFLTGKPAPIYSGVESENSLHFLSLPYDPSFDELYYPATMKHDDYPSLISTDAPVETVAVASALIAFDWPQGTDRYRRLSAFTAALFDKFDHFRGNGRHAKWRETNLAANIPGWRRFKPAQQALDERTQPPAVNEHFTPAAR
jgi:TRAP-type uncharacterized transport system substrate-binding protein